MAKPRACTGCVRAVPAQPAALRAADDHVHLFLVFAFRDARFLSGLYHRFSYIVGGGAVVDVSWRV